MSRVDRERRIQTERPTRRRPANSRKTCRGKTRVQANRAAPVNRAARVRRAANRADHPRRAAGRTRLGRPKSSKLLRSDVGGIFPRHQFSTMKFRSIRHAIFRLHTALLQTIRSEGGEISLLVTLSPTAMSSFSLLPQVSRMFGDMGMTLEFEFAND
jgi:hypothetical protein